MKEKLIRADSLLDQIKSPYTEYPVMIGIRKAIKEMINEAPEVEAIPKKWIINWLTRQTIPALHTCDEYEAVNVMLDDWEKENGTN